MYAMISAHHVRRCVDRSQGSRLVGYPPYEATTKILKTSYSVGGGHVEGSAPQVASRRPLCPGVFEVRLTRRLDRNLQGGLSGVLIQIDVVPGARREGWR